MAKAATTHRLYRPATHSHRATARPEAFNQRGHGHGGSLGEGEPDGHPERDGSTQPNFGQSGTYGKQQHIEAQQRALDDNTDETENH